MNLTKSFAIYLQEKGIQVNLRNVDTELANYKDYLVKETVEMTMCGYDFTIGDFVKIQCPNGDRLEGVIKEFYPHVPQVRLESGWCFHERDTVLLHVSFEEPVKS